MDDSHPILRVIDSEVILLILISSANSPTFASDFYWRSQTALAIDIAWLLRGNFNTILAA